MRASHRPVLAALVMGSAFAPASRAGEPAPKTYKVVLRDRWKAGDVATLSANEKRDKSIVRFIEGKPSENPDDSFKENRVVDQEVVSKCVEADADGYPTKMILWFAKFSYATAGEAGPEKDASLESVFVEVDGVGAARTVTVLSPDAKVSPRAMRWLETEHGKGEKLDALYAALEPKEPAAVATPWTPSGDVIATVLGSIDTPIDGDKSSAEVTLASVDGEKADYHLVVTAVSKGRVVGKGVVPWKTGGTGKIEIRSTRGIAADAFDTSAETEDEFEGVSAEKDAETHVSIKAQSEWVWAKGGTMPEIPKPGAPKPDAPKPDAPVPPAPKPAK